jgi:hypothetical protein
MEKQVKWFTLLPAVSEYLLSFCFSVLLINNYPSLGFEIWTKQAVICVFCPKLSKNTADKGVVINVMFKAISKDLKKKQVYVPLI